MSMAKVTGFDSIDIHGRYTIEELAALSGIPDTTIWKAIDKGKLPGKKIGVKWYITGWNIFIWRDMVPPAQPLADQILARQELGAVPSQWYHVHPWRYYTLIDLELAGGGHGPSEGLLRKAIKSGDLKCNRDIDTVIRVMGIQYLIWRGVFPV